MLPLHARLVDGLIWFFPIILLIASWELLTRTNIISPLLLPPISIVIADAGRLLGTSAAYHHLGISLARAAGAVLAAGVFGVMLGMWMARSNAVRVAFNPLVQMLYPMPKTALLPVVIIWLGIGSLSKMAMIFIGCLVPVVVSAYNGARGVDQTYIWSARSFGRSESEILFDVIWPAALPQILDGLRTSLSYAFVLMISSELVMANDGLGYLVSIYGESGNYPSMFAVIIIVACTGALADRLFLAMRTRLLRWL